MHDPVFIESWLRLVTETMRGGDRAQETFRCLAEAWKSQEELNKWMQRFLPGRSETSRPEEVREWIEDWWKVMGVVPRARYLELLERSEVLRARLVEAEATIQQLRATVGVKGQEMQANEILNVWETTIQTTLKAQNEWLRTWTDIALKNQHERMR
jgi:hypothetical protein